MPATGKITQVIGSTFDAEYPAVIDQIMRAHPPAPSELLQDCPAALDTIVARALAKSRAERYANADDMAMDLHEVAESITATKDLTA